MLLKLEFGSFLTYCPRKDENELIKKSKNFMLALKQEKGINGKLMSEYVTEKINKKLNYFPFKDFFGKDVLLVPIPKSSLTKTDSLWVPEKLAKALEKQNLGICSSIIERIKPVSKSSQVKSEERPKALDHYNSIRIKPSLHQPKEIVLIDDVITRGATILGCASLLREKFPNAKIRAFAIIRTISRPEDFEKIEIPCIGEITLSHGETHRDP